MSDELDAIIEKAESDYWKASEAADAAIRNRDLLEARWDALKEAASLRPPRPPAPSHDITKSPRQQGKGRQPGAISKPWRAVLLKIAAERPNGASDDAIAEIARDYGLENTRPKDARDRMGDYEEHGYVEVVDGLWRVTPRAVQRFGANGLFPEPAPTPIKDTADPDVESAA